MILAYPIAPLQQLLFQLLTITFTVLVIVTAIRRGRESSSSRADSTARIGIIIQVAAIFLACLGSFRPILQPTSNAAIVGSGAVVLLGGGALWLFFASVRALKKNWSIDARMRADHQLVRGGPYARLRHPIYLALLLYLLALGAAAGHFVQLLVAVPLYLWGTAIRMRVEDKLLAETFGADFDVYSRSTPALIPRLG